MNIDIPHETVCFFSDYFPKHLKRLPHIYTWKVPRIEGFNAIEEAKLQKMEINNISSFEENILLKHFLNRAWNSSSCKKRRAGITDDVVSKWGGIRSHGPQTLPRYTQIASSPNPSTPIKGVASYSKVLSITDLNRYAIYDARVAACLNAIQFTGKAKHAVFFPYIPSRNSIIGGNKTSPGFLQLPDFKRKRLLGSGWNNIQNNQAYTTYLDLLQKCSDRLETPIYHLEMVLFAMAAKECVHAMEAVLPNYVPPKRARL